MNITSIGTIGESSLSAKLNNQVTKTDRNESFESLFQSAVSMLKETNDLTNKAEQEEVKWALGYSKNIHDLQNAQTKANQSLQYTISVRNKILEAYKEIMNMQF